jgi:hypothetical protein
MRNRTSLLIGVLLTLSACGGGKPSPTDVVGTYAAEIPSGVSPARSVTLSLAEGNTADMVVVEGSGDTAYTETGTWLVGPRGDVRVVLARDGFGPVSSDLTFRWVKGTLTAVAFDTVQWGALGFALKRQ